MLRTTSFVLIVLVTQAASLVTAQVTANKGDSVAPPFEFANIDDAWAAAQESRDPVLMFVTSDHCYYCKKMLSETLMHPQLAPAVAQLFETTTVNANQNPELVQKLGVRAFPTTLVVSPDGRLLSKLEGFVAPQMLGEHLNPVLRAYYELTERPADSVANR